MATLNYKGVGTECTGGKASYPQSNSDCSSPLPDYSVTADEYMALLETVFALEPLPQLPFDKMSQSVPFQRVWEKGIPLKRRILEYRAKY